MLNDYQVFAAGQMLWPLWAAAATSAGYTITAAICHDKAQLLMVLPGLMVLAAIVFAVGVAPWTNSHSIFGFVAFICLLALALIADFDAMYTRRKPVLPDVLQFLLLPSIPWVFFGGLYT
ncbi:MAG TPA: hypothetical protein VN693_03855 [Rhodanobacteraceae bacterium]|nr:hypothetical protein [Rhodanobacteraceae bacterium]